MLDLRARKREAPVLIFWFSEEKYSISFAEFREYHPLIEPDCFCMRSIAILDHRLYEEFLISSRLTRQEFDLTFDRLFFSDIEERKPGHHLTLIFMIARKKREKIRNRLHSRISEFFDIGIGCMKE